MEQGKLCLVQGKGCAKMKQRNNWRPRAKVMPTTANNLMNKGWQVGLLCSAAVLNDKFDFTDEQIAEFMKACDVLMYSMVRGMDDWKAVERELEKMTGIRLTLHEGMKPSDGRYAIVDERSNDGIE